MASFKSSTAKNHPILTRPQIAHQIATGSQIFILDQKVINATTWLKYHPGGQKTIQHMVGRDATDEVTAFVLLTISERDIVIT
jgi:delta8-fatty-acid desaturase